jgi:hypothetical protein
MPTDFIGLFAILAGRPQDLADVERLRARLEG